MLLYSFIVRMSRAISRTQQQIYPQHLLVQQKIKFKHSLRTEGAYEDQEQGTMRTNYGTLLKNSFAFVLVHLKKTHLTTNKLGVNVPDICLFHQGLPLELLMGEQGEVRSVRGKETIRIKQIYDFFKMRWKQKSLSKEQPTIACYQQEQFEMMTETELFINCRKFKGDPFFRGIQYISNKIGGQEDPFLVTFSSDNAWGLVGTATQSLLGLTDETTLLQKLGHQRYIQCLAVKIALFLNYEHSIRVEKMTCYFTLTPSGYYLTNLTQLHYQNMTPALLRRHHRLQLLEDQRSKLLIMTPRKQQRYSKHEKKPSVKMIEREMHKQWVKIASSMHVPVDQERQREQRKNDEAIRRLFPQKPVRARLTTQNFRSLKKDLGFESRSSLVKRRRCMIKSVKMSHTNSFT